ncbi:MAG: N-acetylneuraminate synthase [Pseudomonadota bacterium]
MNESSIHIDNRRIGDEEQVFVIAEAGVNHNGDLGFAKRLIDVAVEAGADAVKFQSFKTESVISPVAPKADYQIRLDDPGESQFDMVKRLELDRKAHREISSYCRRKDIIFISTPFDEESSDFLEELDVPLFKIASGEITNLPLLRYVAKKGRPMLLSTGMSYLSEVDRAVRSICEEGNPQMALLHCVSNYPAHPSDINLNAMATLRRAFKMPVGYSDHSLGIEIAIAAVALGACIVEKHFTLDKTLPGPDHSMSLDPAELAALVTGIRKISVALGDGIKAPAESEIPMRAIARRSLSALQKIAAGTPITRSMIGIRRPGSGIEPTHLDLLLGKAPVRSIKKDAPLTWDDFLV